MNEQDRKHISDILELGILRGMAEQRKGMCGPHGDRLNKLEGNVERAQKDIETVAVAAVTVAKAAASVARVNGQSANGGPWWLDFVLLRKAATYIIILLIAATALVRSVVGTQQAEKHNHAATVRMGAALEKYEDMTELMEIILGIPPAQPRGVDYATTGTR